MASNLLKSGWKEQKLKGANLQKNLRRWIRYIISTPGSNDILFCLTVHSRVWSQTPQPSRWFASVILMLQKQINFANCSDPGKSFNILIFVWSIRNSKICNLQHSQSNIAFIQLYYLHWCYIIKSRQSCVTHWIQNNPTSWLYSVKMLLLFLKFFIGCFA